MSQLAIPTPLQSSVERASAPSTHELGTRTIGMPRGAMLRIDDARGLALFVREGVLVISEEGAALDRLVAAGDALVLDAPGLTLVCAARRASVTIARSDARARPRRIALRRHALGPLVTVFEDRPASRLAMNFTRRARDLTDALWLRLARWRRGQPVNRGQVRISTML
jgi:hypothetical protein